jgi:hypothetical protein
MTAARSRRAEPPEATSGPGRLQISVHAPGDPARAAEALGAGREGWLGQPVDRVDGRDRYVVDLELRVVEQAPRVAFHKAAFVDLPPLDDPSPAGAVRLPISWRAASLAPLFPVFAGTLTWEADELRLDGYYEPPGGNVGVVMDRLMLNAAARATARRLLERIAEAIRG